MIAGREKTSLKSFSGMPIVLFANIQKVLLNAKAFPDFFS